MAVLGPILLVYELKIEILYNKNALTLLLVVILSRHNFANVMIAQLSWHVQNCDLI